MSHTSHDLGVDLDLWHNLWRACVQDRVAEVQNELYGYGDKELLKISEPDFDTRL